MIENKFEIQLPEDVAKFFFWLVFEKRIDIHPDDTVSQYIDIQSKEPTFTLEEALYYDRVRESCFDVCEKYGVCIYEIATRVLNLFYYCDKNEMLEYYCKPDNYDTEEEGNTSTAGNEHSR